MRKYKTHMISIIFLILQYLIYTNIYIMGDDYMYATFAKKGIIESVFSYYNSGNGRWLVNIIDSFVLKYDRFVYLILGPWILLLLAFLLYKTLKQLTGKYDDEMYILALISVAAIDVSLNRETAYWITGAMNYVIPAILFLAAICATFKIQNDNDRISLKKIVYGAICIVSSMTMEQFSLMTIGWITLFFGCEMITSKKIRKDECIIFLLSVVALSSIIFAPGNGERIQAATENGQSLYIKIMDLFYNNYYSAVASKVIFILIILQIIMLINMNKKKLAIMGVINAGIVLTNINIRLHFFVIIIGFGIFCVNLVVVLRDYVRSDEMMHILTLAILAIGSQIMLLPTEIWGFRTSYAVIIIYIMLSLYLYSKCDNKRVFPLICGGIIICENIIMGCITIVCIYAISKWKNHSSGATILAVVAILVVLLPVANGYHENREIHIGNENEALSGRKEIVVKRYNDDLYGWNSPPLGQFHEEYFREYYGIDDMTNIVYLND